jgi:hypothetical protein
MVANIYWEFINDKNRSDCYTRDGSHSICEAHRSDALSCWSDDDDHCLLDATGAHTDARNARDVRHPQDSLFGSDRGDWPARCHDHVRESTFNPEASRLIKVANVTGAMPTRRLRRCVLGDPEIVVALFCMRGADYDLTGDPRRSGELRARATCSIERGDCNFDSVHRSADKHSVADSCRFNL